MLAVRRTVWLNGGAQVIERATGDGPDATGHIGTTLHHYKRRFELRYEHA